MGDPFLTSSGSAATQSDKVAFVCNLCGTENAVPRTAFGRETPSCARCGSTVRTRAIVRMIARELFGADLVLPDFPRLKAVRGIGISDSADYAERLAEKFDYRNTHYHKDPAFDITQVPEGEYGAYDFLIASEVFEHVAPPVETAFRNACRLLKPNGLFFFTVPYTLDERTTEHFPELHDYGIAQLRDRHVLVNRTREGQLQVFEDLVFHGGGGSTLEIRRFTERDLRALFAEAGFRALELYSESHEPFGVCHQETWSLPMAARKEPFALKLGGIAELLEQSTAERKRLESQIEALTSEHEQFAKWANGKIAEVEGELKERTAWARDLERQLEQRTGWALSLEKDLAGHVELAKRFQAEAQERTEWAVKLQAEVEELRARLARLEGALWTKAGRATGFVKG
jgi:SAM-dependent methyltransferase